MLWPLHGGRVAIAACLAAPVPPALDIQRANGMNAALGSSASRNPGHRPLCSPAPSQFVMMPARVTSPPSCSPASRIASCQTERRERRQLQQRQRRQRRLRRHRQHRPRLRPLPPLGRRESGGIIGRWVTGGEVDGYPRRRSASCATRVVPAQMRRGRTVPIWRAGRRHREPETATVSTRVQQRRLMPCSQRRHHRRVRVDVRRRVAVTWTMAAMAVCPKIDEKMTLALRCRPCLRRACTPRRFSGGTRWAAMPAVARRRRPGFPSVHLALPQRAASTTSGANGVVVMKEG